MTSLISVCSNNFSGVLIGRLYSSKDLAFVNRGKGLPQLVMDSINETLGRVAFPALSQLQDRRDIQREVVRKMISVSTFFVFPLMACVAVCAHNLVLFLFGDQWIPIVPYLQVSCFSFALWPLHTINLQAINSIGRSGLLLKLEIVKRILGLIVIIMSIKFGVFWMVAAEAFIFGPLGVIINSWPNRKLLNYTLEMQLRDVLPAALISGVVAIPVVALNFIPIHSQLARFGLLSAQCVVTVVLFVGLSFYFRLRGLREIGEIAKGRILAKFPRLLPLFSYLEK